MQRRARHVVAQAGQAETGIVSFRRMPVGLQALVAVVVAIGAVLILASLRTLRTTLVNPYLGVLAVLTIVSGRFAIKVPGRSATVSVSEVFVFAAVLLLGPGAATIIVAVDGCCASLLQADRRVYRALFNIAEPAVSTWTAAQVFLAINGPHGSLVGTSAIVAAAVAMAAVFFVLNSGLTALAIGLESGASAFDIWRRHARTLAANYYAAASLAALAVSSGGAVNVAIVALVVPLLILSYLAYEEASIRVDDANRHLNEIGHLYQATTEMLAIAVDAKDQVTHGHIRRVQRRTLAVARALGVTEPRELKAIEAGALLHDIGKLAVPDFVLNKPSALTRAEFDVIKAHATMGARILMAVDFPYPVVPIVRHHHEQWNGRGYPDGLAGSEIPLGARIIAVVDCYDALTSDRPYRPRLDPLAAIDLLRSRKGTFYDPGVVEQFIDLLPALEADDVIRDDETTTRMPLVGRLASAGVDLGAWRDPEDASPPIARRVRSMIDQRIGRFAGAEGCLFALAPAGDVLLVAHATPRLRERVASLRVPLGSGVSGWVAGNRSTIREANPVLDLGEIATAAGLRSCTSAPVFAGADVFGALTIYRPGGQPAENIAEAVGVLAQEVGLAIARGADDVDYASPRVAGRGRYIVAAS